MKLPSRYRWILAGAFVAVGLLTIRPSNAQDDVLRDRPPAEGEIGRAERDDRFMRKAGAMSGMHKTVIKMRGGPDRVHDIREAATALSEAEGEDAKADADKKLNRLLDKYFEEDMERREQELADVEARVKKLRALMERRREKKDEIIDLQVKVLLNEAGGLGFFGDEPPGGQSPFEARVWTYPMGPSSGGPMPRSILGAPPSPPGAPVPATSNPLAVPPPASPRRPAR